MRLIALSSSAPKPMLPFPLLGNLSSNVRVVRIGSNLMFPFGDTMALLVRVVPVSGPLMAPLTVTAHFFDKSARNVRDLE